MATARPRAEQSIMRFEALVLDMDGVLADTEPLHVKAWNQALSGVSAEAVYDERSKLQGMASPDIARELIRTFRLPFTVEELVSRKREIFRSYLQNGLRPFPGLAEELTAWKGFPMALATASPRLETRLMLEHMGLDRRFAAVVTNDDVSRPKPAPDCYLLAARRLQVSPGACVVIEDSLHGIRAALDAGAQVLAISPIGLPPGFEPVQVFPSTVEALRWLRKAG